MAIHIETSAPVLLCSGRTDLVYIMLLRLSTVLFDVHGLCNGVSHFSTPSLVYFGMIHLRVRAGHAAVTPSANKFPVAKRLYALTRDYSACKGNTRILALIRVDVVLEAFGSE